MQYTTTAVVSQLVALGLDQQDLTEQLTITIDDTGLAHNWPRDDRPTCSPGPRPTKRPLSEIIELPLCSSCAEPQLIARSRVLRIGKSLLFDLEGAGVHRTDMTSGDPGQLREHIRNLERSIELMADMIHEVQAFAPELESCAYASHHTLVQLRQDLLSTLRTPANQLLAANAASLDADLRHQHYQAGSPPAIFGFVQGSPHASVAWLDTLILAFSYGSAQSNTRVALHAPLSVYGSLDARQPLGSPRYLRAGEDMDSLFEIALELWDPSTNGQLSTFAGAIDAARGVLR